MSTHTMSWIIMCVVCGILGFICGFLVGAPDPMKLDATDKDIHR